ncbi:MAG: hypothetical protein LBT82_02410 [Oscillospiraceae bacterium]|nr:hypothetical protein [Oscillospiraceae bacterium]
MFFIENNMKKEAKFLLNRGNWAKSVGLFIFISVIFLEISDIFESFLFKNCIFLFNAISLFDSTKKGVFAILFDFNVDINLFYSAICYLIFRLLLLSLVIFFSSPLLLGCAKFYFDMAIGRSVSMGLVFYFFKNSDKLLKSFFFLVFIISRLVCACFVSLLPGFVVAIISFKFKKSYFEFSYWFFSFYVFLILLGVFLFLIWASKYFLSPFLFIIKENLDISKTLNVSCTLMKKRFKFSVLKIFLIFFSWLILSYLFIFPGFYFYPLFFETLAISAKWIIKKGINDKLSKCS